VSGRAGEWIGWTTTGCVALLAVIAGTVSYLHTHQLVAGHGQPGWVAALTPLSVDGMIVAASTALLSDSRSGGRMPVKRPHGSGDSNQGSTGRGPGSDGYVRVVRAALARWLVRVMT